jgi:hypothetical protein
VKRIGELESRFENGRASAIAIALVVETVGGVEKRRVAWWNQQVELQRNDALVNIATEALHAEDPAQRAREILTGNGELATPLPFRGD